MSAGIDLHALADAIDEMGAWFHCDTWNEVGPHLTCNEADALAGVLRSLGLADLADALVHAHGVSDYEPTDDHHAVYLADQEAAR